MTRTNLTPEELRFLSTFEIGLEAMERDLLLAQIIGYYDRPQDVRHPVLAFALRHAPVAVITVTIVQFAEALDSHLDHASQALLGRSLWKGNGRNRRLIDPDFQKLKDLRDARVAHSIKLRPRGDAAVREARESGGTVIAFLLRVLTKIRSLMTDLVQSGLFRGVQRRPVLLRTANLFSRDDLIQLIGAANVLVKPSA